MLSDAPAALVLAIVATVAFGPQSESRPDRKADLTEAEAIRLAVPDYDRKVRESQQKLANRSDPMAWIYTYTAHMAAIRTVSFGVKHGSLAVVAVQEEESQCNRCFFLTVAVVTIPSRRVLGRCRVEGSLTDPDNLQVTPLQNAGSPRVITFRSLVISHPDFEIEGRLEPVAAPDHSLSFRCTQKEVAAGREHG